MHDAEPDEEALRVAHLDLAAAQGNGQAVRKLPESRLIVAGADDQEIVHCAEVQSIRTSNSDAQCRKSRLPAEVSHQRNEGFNLLLGRRGRKHDCGFAQIGKARKWKARVGEHFKIGQRRVVRIAAQIEIGVAQDGALHVDGRGVFAIRPS